MWIILNNLTLKINIHSYSTIHPSSFFFAILLQISNFHFYWGPIWFHFYGQRRLNLDSFLWNIEYSKRFRFVFWFIIMSHPNTWNRLSELLDAHCMNYWTYGTLFLKKKSNQDGEKNSICLLYKYRSPFI